MEQVQGEHADFLAVPVGAGQLAVLAVFTVTFQADVPSRLHLLGCAGPGRQPEEDRRVAVPLGLLALLPEEGEREVDTLDFTEPALVRGASPPQGQILLKLVEAGQHLRVNLKDGTPDARVLVRTTSSVGPPAVAEFDLALVEVLLELAPLRVAGRAVLVVGPQRAAAGKVGLVVADEVLFEDRDIAPPPGPVPG